MPRHYDPMIYRHPRTLHSAFRCDSSDAVAGWCYRRPLRDQIANGVAVGLMLSLLLACALDYFDCLVR